MCEDPEQDSMTTQKATIQNKVKSMNGTPS